MQHKCTCINFNHSRCLWWGQLELKAGKYHNFWRFIKLAIIAFLREGPFFYFYVESPPSTVMHRLREHSCHSEYNVHCPKVFIDSYCWFHLFLNYLYLVALLNLKVSYAFMFCSPWGTSWKPFVCFSLWFEHTFDFHCFIFVIFHLCSFSCYNMVAKFLLSRLCLSCPCFKFFWSERTTLTYLIKIV
jgi:hypothetical protein